jgi:serine/threonine-protein kinase
MISLRTFGALDLRDAEGTEVRAVLAQPRRVAILAYLAIATPRGFHRRDTLLSVFWPERDTERARASLNRAVYFLRRELGDVVLQSRGDAEIQLDPERFWCDASAFDKAAAERRYSDAVELYRGELMPGFFVSQAPGFDEWLENQRTSFRARASDAAWALAEQEDLAGDVASAVHWARRGVELAPFHEAAFRRLLVLLDRSGDRTGAAHAYARFVDEVAAALDVSPSPETQALIDLIRARTRRASSPEALGSVAAGSLHPEAIELPALRLTSVAPTTVRPRMGTVPRLAAVAAVTLVASFGVMRFARAGTIDPFRVDFARWENQTGDPSLDRLGVLAADRMLSGGRQSGLVREGHVLASPGGTSNAGTLVTGSFDGRGGNLTLHAVITDVRRGGKTWPIAAVSVRPDQADQALDSIRSRVLAAIAVLHHPRFATLLPVATEPPAFEAYQEFLEGVSQQDKGQIHDALQHYRWAAAIDTSFTWPLVQAGLASLYWYRGDLTAQVDSFVSYLRGIRVRLQPLQRLLLDHIAAVRAEDWEAAYLAMRAAASLAPREFSLSFGTSALERNRPREAVEALTRPGLDSIYRMDIQGYWRTLTLSQHLLDEHWNELETARRARLGTPQSAMALFQELRALTALGRTSAVQASLDTLLALPLKGWFTPPLAMELLANELRAHGHAEMASRVYARAIGWLQSRPTEERRTQGRREHLAKLLYLAGRFDDADTLYQALVREYPVSRGYPDNVLYLGYLGMIAARRGDSIRAQELSVQLRAKERAQPVPGQEAVVFRAKIAALLGAYDEAMRLLLGAYGVGGANELHGDVDFEVLKDFLPYRRLMTPRG